MTKREKIQRVFTHFRPQLLQLERKVCSLKVLGICGPPLLLLSGELLGAGCESIRKTEARVGKSPGFGLAICESWATLLLLLTPGPGFWSSPDASSSVQAGSCYGAVAASPRLGGLPILAASLLHLLLCPLIAALSTRSIFCSDLQWARRDGVCLSLRTVRRPGDVRFRGLQQRNPG